MRVAVDVSSVRVKKKKVVYTRLRHNLPSTPRCLQEIHQGRDTGEVANKRRREAKVMISGRGEGHRFAQGSTEYIRLFAELLGGVLRQGRCQL